MDSINKWFKGDTDYYVGVALYASLPSKNPRTLKRLNRGKTNANMATLVSELRKYKSHTVPKRAKPVVKFLYVPPKIPDQDTINMEMERRKLAQESAKKEFGGIRLGDLPEKLRPRLISAQKIFYEMIELKFALNDVLDKDQDKALSIQLQIYKLDEERDLIWKELHHWKQHRSFLPVPEDDFSGLSAIALIKAKNSLKSNISKITKRINEKYKALESETNKHKRLVLESRIRKSETRLHGHKANMNKINALI